MKVDFFFFEQAMKVDYYKEVHVIDILCLQIA